MILTFSKHISSIVYIVIVAHACTHNTRAYLVNTMLDSSDRVSGFLSPFDVADLNFCNEIKTNKLETVFYTCKTSRIFINDI